MIKLLPKISVITPSFNQGKYIRDTIHSVLDQNYPSFEHIIIDNCSTDNTLEIVKEFPHLKVISEKDKGPANAINKGMKLAEGEICAWINSDDYYEKNIFNDIAAVFNDKESDLVSANITFIYPDDNNRIDKIKVKPYTLEKLIHDSADSVCQAGLFFKRQLFWEAGGLNESLKLVFDYDLLIKMLQKGNYVYLDQNVAYQRMYKGTLTKRNLRKQALEIYKVSRQYGSNLSDKIMLKSVVRKFILPWKY